MNKWQNAIYLTGGMLMVVGAGCYCFLVLQEFMCWVFLVGAIMFSIMQMAQTYEGTAPTLKRLKRIQSIADIFFILAGMLMVDSAYGILQDLFTSTIGAGYYTYIEYVYNKWVVVLLIAAFLEVYTTHRIDYELKKTKNT